MSNATNNQASTGQLRAHLALFSEQLHNYAFADRGTNIREAYEYAFEIAKASDNPPAVTTAVFVVTNTIANYLADMAGQVNKESENV